VKVTEVIGLRGITSCGTCTCGEVRLPALSLQLSAELLPVLLFGPEGLKSDSGFEECGGLLLWCGENVREVIPAPRHPHGL
jgi:hypothetical protein